MATPRAAVLVAVFLAGLCLAHSLALVGRDDEVAAELEAAGKRDGRRITRDRYRMGYLFGKRSDMDSNAGLLIETLTRKAIAVADVAAALQTDPALATQVARHLDRNGDGYVSVSELL